ncbi:MAG TPA: DCC1-like thiol-disulfide oxidoreductase family protein [Humibacter sp.]|nr:DCC1-like thiol-disulfide oxidoreductase family protein [Humibacter sp.]
MDAIARSGRGVLVFDGDCAFCTSSLRVIRRLVPAMPDAVPFQRADLDTLGLTAQEASERVWFVTARHQFGGHLALAAILRHQPVAWQRALGRLAVVPPWSWAAAAAYLLVARNRHRLPGGTPACRLES